MTEPGLLGLSACRLAELLRDGAIGARELTNASLKEIEANDRDLKAFITVDADAAMGAADAADASKRRGDLLGRLHGIPIGIKDLIGTRGLRTTYGSSIFKDNVPSEDDLVVARLRQAGAIIVGKTNTPEFGFGAITSNPLYGPTCNPHDLTRTTGGSSGGSAAAVCAGMVPLAVGTDFGGSVRTPASFCGIVGVRPTPGVIPHSPKRLPWEALHVYGPMARTVEDAALLLEVMSGGDDHDPIAAGRAPLTKTLGLVGEAKRNRIAASIDLGIAEIDVEVARVLEGALESMRRAGLSVETVRPDLGRAREAFETIRAATLYQSLGEHLDKDLTETVRWNVERGRGLSANELLNAEMERGQIYRRMIDLLQRHDLIVTAAASILPFPNQQGGVTEINGKPLRNMIDYLTVTYVFSLVGLPALSLPVGWSREGLPVGLQIVGRPFEEERLLSFAYWLQEELDFRYRAPKPMTTSTLATAISLQ